MGGVYQIPDAVWQQIESLIPPQLKEERSGVDNRQVMTAMLAMLRTNSNCEELPHSSETEDEMHVRFQEWQQTGVLDRMWQTGILTDDEFRTLARRGR